MDPSENLDISQDISERMSLYFDKIIDGKAPLIDCPTPCNSTK